MKNSSVVFIGPPKRGISFGLPEVWAHRELLYFLTWRDIKVRYKQTVLGASWAILQPVLTMVIFSLFFGRLASMPSDGLPYPLFAFAALVPWTFFSNGLSTSSNSLVGSSNLITKVYFPRLTIPLSTVMAGCVDFLLAFGVLILMMVYYRVEPSWRLVAIPGFFAMAFFASLGVGLWLSAMNVQFRDVRYTVPFLTQLWLFATPVAYPASLLSEPWRTVYGLNPMVGVVEGFRWAILGTNTQPAVIIAVSAASTVVLVVSGILYFRRMEHTFADVV